MRIPRKLKKQWKQISYEHYLLRKGFYLFKSGTHNFVKSILSAFNQVRNILTEINKHKLI